MARPSDASTIRRTYHSWDHANALIMWLCGGAKCGAFWLAGYPLKTAGASHGAEHFERTHTRATVPSWHPQSRRRAW